MAQYKEENFSTLYVCPAISMWVSSPSLCVSKSKLNFHLRQEGTLDWVAEQAHKLTNPEMRSYTKEIFFPTENFALLWVL